MESGIRVAGQPEGGVGGDVVGGGGVPWCEDCPASFPLDCMPAPSGLTHTQRRPCALPFGEPDLGGPGRRLIRLWLGRGRSLGVRPVYPGVWFAARWVVEIFL